MVLNGVKYERNPDFIYRTIVDEAVLVPMHQNVADMDCLYTLNAVGIFIWEHLESPATKAEILASLQNEYDADLEVLTTDLDHFLMDMIEIDALRKV